MPSRALDRTELRPTARAACAFSREDFPATPPIPATPAPRARWTPTQLLWTIIAAAFLVRLLTLGLYPLTDNTEARYAEIARKMVETGHWLVPQIDYGVPFWGKPPLSIWLTAASFEAFGINAFAARLPSFLLGAGVCWLAFCLGLRQGGQDYGLRAAAVVATSLLMFVSAGGVMTDPAMVLGTTLSMAGYWLAMTTASRYWGYLFFVGLAIGLLAKGPIATVLTVLPIAAWSVMAGRVAESWRRLPWLRGIALTMLLVVPWYWAAELHSPGFLRYFLVGEHWERFLVPGWKGDLYGVGHAYPRGMIWLYYVLGTLPWSPWLVWRLLRHREARSFAPGQADASWRGYLLCWMLAPAVFFTLSRNILPTYVLPGMVGFGLLVADVWLRTPSSAASSRPLYLAWVTPALALVLLVAWAHDGYPTQRRLVAAYQQAADANSSLVYFRQRPYSAEFYSGGTALRAADTAALRHELARNPEMFIATERSAVGALSGDLDAPLVVVATSDDGKYVLLRPTDANGIARSSSRPEAAGESPPGRAAGAARWRTTRE